MNQPIDPPIVMGRVCRVTLDSPEGGVLLSVGSISIRLDVGTAEDVAATLTQALLVCLDATPETFVTHRTEIQPTEIQAELDDWDMRPSSKKPVERKAN
jgi:hypothetical protein